jgi:hypothetical protein
MANLLWDLSISSPPGNLRLHYREQFVRQMTFPHSMCNGENRPPFHDRKIASCLRMRMMRILLH